MDIHTGIKAEIQVIVSDADTAAYHGSGSIPVFATPALVSLMERTAVKALADVFPEGQTTVGGRIDVHHIAASPVGIKVRVQAELVEIQGRKLIFNIQAWDEVEVVGKAVHERFIIDEQRFMSKVKRKSQN